MPAETAIVAVPVWERRISPAAVTEATGRDWEAWFGVLEAAGAREMPHAQIAAFLSQSGLLPQAEWWAQMITVGYEQYIGRREAGQAGTGEYNATASRTLEATMDEALERWVALIGTAMEFDGVPLQGVAAVSSTPKWRYWRAALADGSKINVNISARSPTRIGLQVEHRNVGSADAAEAWKVFWKSRLNQL